MKNFLTYLFLVFGVGLFAQKTCELSTDVIDSLGTYKSTKEYIVHERVFAGNSNYLFFSLINTNGTPLLQLQTIQKSEDFIKAYCMDVNTKIFLQLMNGKVITLLHNEEENCGSMIRVAEENKNTRINSGFFLFIKGSIEDLKSSPVTLMRVKYGTETLDYVFKKELKSELTGLTYFPENYFIDYLHCVN